MTKENAQRQEAENNLPLFYEKPAPLLKDKHAKSGLKEAGTGYAFARNTNSVPLTVREFADACKNYPIVFSTGDKPDAIALLGFETRKNLFVSPDGKWKSGTYVPAYVRRYPFIFMDASQGADQKYILCVDESAERYAPNAKNKESSFFDEKGEQTNLTRHAMEFCMQYHRDNLMTAEFSEALHKADILRPKQVNLAVKDGKNPIVLNGFNVVDNNLLRDLPSKTVEEWHRNGYLSLIHMHLLSLTNFNKLSTLVK